MIHSERQYITNNIFLTIQNMLLVIIVLLLIDVVVYPAEISARFLVSANDAERAHVICKAANRHCPPLRGEGNFSKFAKCVDYTETLSHVTIFFNSAIP
jgi:hypothetical protein